jgi:hypothetical protein
MEERITIFEIKIYQDEGKNIRAIYQICKN